MLLCKQDAHDSFCDRNCEDKRSKKNEGNGNKDHLSEKCQSDTSNGLKLHGVSFTQVTVNEQNLAKQAGHSYLM